MSDELFDDKIREALEGHEPDVNPNWDKMKERIAAAAAIGAIGVDAAGSKIATQLSVGAAVMLGAATMWVAQQVFTPEEFIVEDPETLIEEIISDAAQKMVDAEAVDKFEEEYAEAVKSEEVGGVSEEIESTDNSEPANSNDDVLVEETADSEDSEVVEVAEVAEEINVEVVKDELPFAVSMESSCVGAKVDFKLTGTEENDSYLWNFGDGNFSTEPHPTHQYKLPGVYDVTLSVRSKGKGGIKTKTIENLITINPQPKANLNWDFPIQKSKDIVLVDLIDKTAEANSSTWVINGNIMDKSRAELKVPGKYDINLIASNQFGCQDHVGGILYVGSRQELNAPGRFSPNNDGRYDSFMPFDLEKMSEKWKLTISDKKGKVVYSTTDFNQPWNGEMPSGNLASNSSKFFWQVVVTDFKGSKRIYSDVVVVER